MTPTHEVTISYIDLYSPGDVFQVNEKHGRAGWTGAFVLATEIKSWGIQGFVHNIDSNESASSIYIRLQWQHIDYVGKAKLQPADIVVSELAKLDTSQADKEP